MFSTANSKGQYKPVSISSYDSDESDQEDDFIQQEIRNQRLQLQEQDNGLEFLSESATRLGSMSLGISEELNHQNKMLNEMEDELDQATTDLNMLTRKTRELIKQAGGKKNFVIIMGMSFVVIILLLLIIYS
mmetsp:Transcript_21510/g.25621  ORF Transcript_21510/g.25621 Transcript_21510/m.25621 type:complete len:132 (-) Transcript_21510:90-485(-)